MRVEEEKRGLEGVEVRVGREGFRGCGGESVE